jgi:hypothetical protein
MDGRESPKHANCWQYAYAARFQWPLLPAPHPLGAGVEFPVALRQVLF